MLQQISIDDARAFVNTGSDGLDRDLVIFNRFNEVDFTGKVLQLGFMVVCFCSEGSASFRLNGRDYTITPGDMLISFGEQIIEQCRPTSDFSGHMALISSEYFLESTLGLQPLWPYLLYVFAHPVIRLTEAERQWLLSTSDTIQMRLQNKTHHFRRESILTLMRVFYYDVCSILARRDSETAGVPSRSYTLFDRFIKLAVQYFREHRDVKWYSVQMCLTPKYLSEVVKQVSGKTAGQWLTNLTMTEICCQLRDKGLSIKEIAQSLNFPTQSFLGKYFKNVTGKSPTEYRREHIH